MQNTTPVVIKAALSELACLQALHLAHVHTVLCGATLKILGHILNGFLLLAPEAGRHDYGSHLHVQNHCWGMSS